MAGGKSCDKARACFNGGNPNDSCDASTSATPSCSGHSEQYCDGLISWSYDCSSSGQTCIPSVGCTPGQTCFTKPGNYNYCEGSFVGNCGVNMTADGGFTGYFKVDAHCAALGSTCGSYPWGGGPLDGAVAIAGCIGPGPACAGGRCDGSALVGCLGGHEARTECAGLGLGCFTRTGSNFDFATVAFCAVGTDCTTTSSFCGLGAECGLDHTDSCKGNVLTYCDLGKITTVDCVAAGWAGCVSDKQGTRCSP